MHTDYHYHFLKDRSQEFGADRCFICGCHIPDGSALRTVEHMFPKWLLRELDLWNGTVHQLNDELLPYRQLTVPCCVTCNGRDLSAVEARVKAAFLDGVEAFSALDRRDLFIWFGKIYYGLIYKENLRPRYVREQDGERLVPESHLQSVSFHHFLLQAAGGFVSWEPAEPGPASFHFFECLDDERPSRRFGYMDDIHVPIVGLRMGSIGVVCILQDWGRSEGVQQLQLNTARGMKLHPTQFREVYARLSYMTKVSWNEKKHMIIGGHDTALVIAGDPGAFSGSFVLEEYVQTLSAIDLAGVQPMNRSTSSATRGRGQRSLARSHPKAHRDWDCLVQAGRKPPTDRPSSGRCYGTFPLWEGLADGHRLFGRVSPIPGVRRGQSFSFKRRCSSTFRSTTGCSSRG
jgi:hypothetical protein